MTRHAIRHVTTYRYDAPVSYGLQQVRLIPKTRAGQEVIDWTTTITGGRVETAFDDHPGNSLLRESPPTENVFETPSTSMAIGVSGPSGAAAAV